MDKTKEIARAYKESAKDFSQGGTEKILQNERKLEEKFKKSNALKGFFADFKLAISMIKDYTNGNYKKVPWHVITGVGGAILYVLMPIDLIPDFIPVSGFIDDAAVFAFMISKVRKELTLYQQWKELSLHNGGDDA